MAAAVASTLQDWMRGLPGGRITSLGVFSDGKHIFCDFLHLLWPPASCAGRRPFCVYCCNLDISILFSPSYLRGQAKETEISAVP